MTDPRQAAVDRVDALIHSWCNQPVDLCPCDPRPLPEPQLSPTVLAIQRFGRAESLRAAPNPPAGSGTPDATPEAVSDTVGPQDGPVCNLFPTSKAGAA